MRYTESNYTDSTSSSTTQYLGMREDETRALRAEVTRLRTENTKLTSEVKRLKRKLAKPAKVKRLLRSVS